MSEMKCERQNERDRERERQFDILFLLCNAWRNYNGRMGRSFDNDFLNAGLRR